MNPLSKFKAWFRLAKKEYPFDHTAFNLSTSINNKPYSRMVLLKKILPDGFIFFTNLNSNKGKQFKSNSNLSMCFYWDNLKKQIRIVGKITPEKVKILQDADHIFINELIVNNLYDKIWQAYAALLPIKTVGVMGDSRTYEYTCLLRAVTSEDGMTADYFNFPKDFFDKISNKIVNGVPGINRVVYDITSKPPSKIELE